jgi:hypothetical protein
LIPRRTGFSIGGTPLNPVSLEDLDMPTEKPGVMTYVDPGLYGVIEAKL